MTSGSPSGSRRTTPLPPDWPAIRRRVLLRDAHRCQIRTPSICVDPHGVRANEVDHIGPAGDHRDEMLRAACGPCHARRTGQQAGLAAGVRRRARAAARKRPPEPHPGIVS
jgi:5-methylcytosine-specific restriction protein A